jgi:hypothetical protein
MATNPSTKNSFNDDVQAAIVAAQTLRERIKPYFTDTPDDAYKRSLKVSKRREPYLNEGMTHLREHSSYLPGSSNMSAIETTYNRWKALEPLVNVLDALRQEYRQMLVRGIMAQFKKRGMATDRAARNMAYKMADLQLRHV